MKYTFCSIIAFIFIISSCENKQGNKGTISQNEIDTILTVDSLNFFQSISQGMLTKELAHKTLLEYFLKKGYFAQEKVSLDSLLTYPVDNEEPMCIMFDTLYTAHLNKDKVLDGIITYWQMPCGASGTNWRPHRAIITSIDNKYTIISPDIIPDYYSIDSISQDSNYTYIHGQEFDRSTREFAKTFKASIKK